MVKRPSSNLDLVDRSAPSVTVVLPVYNEAEAIDACLASLAAQDYPGPLAVIVAEGRSTDGTRDRLEPWADRLALRVIDNPHRVQSRGVNLAAAQAEGEILVRADAHTTYAPDYVRRSVEALSASKAAAVGGLMNPQGDTAFSRAVAAAMMSPLMVGPAKFHHSTTGGEVDTVYLGAFRRHDFLAADGYRSFPAGVAEDADLYDRWRRRGKRIVLDLSIRSTYRPRSTLGGLFRQFFRYGRGKADLLFANGRWPSWRPLGPLALVVGLVTLGAVAVFTPWQWPLVALVLIWLAALSGAALPSGRLAPLVVAVGAIMHIAYGLGLARDLLRGPGPVRRMIGAGSQSESGPTGG